MKYILLAATLLTCLLNACRDADIPDGVLEDPVFSVNSSVSSQKAGENGVYLFTNAAKDSAGVLVFSCAFAPVDCPGGDCPGSLKFMFRNRQPGNVVSLDTLFNPDQGWYYREPIGSGLQSVTIQWVSENGIVFRSDQMVQAADAYLIIDESGPWENNENDKRTWKMDITFACRIFGPINEELDMVGEAVIAVAYEE